MFDVQMASSTVAVPPKMGVFLTQIAETSDVETALWKILTDYTDLKIRSLRQRIRMFETKWGMRFEEFVVRDVQPPAGPEVYAYEIESDFWEWEEAETLLRHYEDVRARWT